MAEKMDGVVLEKEEEELETPKVSTVIEKNIDNLSRAVTQFDARFTLRALRAISTVRKNLDANSIAESILQTFLPNNEDTARFLLEGVGASSDSIPTFLKKSDAQMSTLQTQQGHRGDVLPEAEVYLGILIQVYLWDNKHYQQGAIFSEKLVTKIRTYNRRTLDSLAPRAYFYLSLFVEQLEPKAPSSQSPVLANRRILLGALRSAVLRKDTETQAAVLVLLLRNYVVTADYSQADALVAQTTFPQNAPHNQVARYMYYLGRIRAIQLRYTEAHEHLTSATRKAPTSAVAVGFYQSSMRFLVVVELLMGDIPERSIFSQPKLENALRPYFRLVQAVRAGEMQGFLKIVTENADTFRRDGTYTLVLRLRQNVIRTGIRRLSLVYSRISLRDICIRLGLENEESAEYIVAKAIRDGVIEASVAHEDGFMQTKQAGDVYATREPAEAFHERIKATMALHDECVKAMRFPMNQHRLELKNAQEARERERELAKEIQEGDMDDDEDASGDYNALP
ncbi:hypothetical protein EJ06DRAFT_528363 [Trichodelitschia bisporula]|uniref:PCI domain-containing protein n=1 Tax=Trichodelitschia bisporula TaxID=703511 RepID=A0A6G1I1R4_9PEZI|nr:hypothetical protein EJ06DRAFT_528363 [Trichodelitschia bisporula]